MIKNLKLALLKYKNVLARYFSPNISSSVLFGSNVQILGIANTLIKGNCTIGEQTLFTINNRSKKEIQLVIGTNTYIGRDNFFSVGKAITIGDYCIFGNKCSFICSDHIFDTPLVPYAFTGNSFNKSIKIGVNCWLGHDVSIVGNVTIGHGCVIGAKSLITKNIPPFSMVVGNPGRILKTFSFASGGWVDGILDQTSEYMDEDKYRDHLINHSERLPAGHHSASSWYGDL